MATVGPVGADTQALSVEVTVTTATVIQIKRFIFNFQLTLYCFLIIQIKIVATNSADVFAIHYCLVELQLSFANRQDIPEHMDNICRSPHSNTRLQALAGQPKP